MELIPETSGIIKFFLLLTIALSGLSSYTLSSTTSSTLYVQLGVNDEILCSTLNILLSNISQSLENTKFIAGELSLIVSLALYRPTSVYEL